MLLTPKTTNSFQTPKQDVRNEQAESQIWKELFNKFKKK